MFAYCLFARSWRGATIGGGKADVLCSRGAGALTMAHFRLLSYFRPRARGGLNDMEEKNCAIDFCPRARGGYKRIYILDRFKIVSVRLRGAGLQGARAEMVIALPSACAGTWRSDHGSFQAAFVFPSACAGRAERYGGEELRHRFLSACAGRVQTYLHIGSVQDSLRPVARSGRCKGRVRKWL